MVEHAEQQTERMVGHPLAGQQPSKIIAVHLSYRSRAMERGRLPLWPSYFLKPPSTLAADGHPVLRPPWCELLAFEGEVALVIGTTASRVSPADAWGYALRWITAANTTSASTTCGTPGSGSNLRSKGIDGFTPLEAWTARRPGRRPGAGLPADLGQRAARPGRRQRR